MVNLDDGFFRILLAIDFLEQVEHLTLGIGIPAAIAAAHLDLHARHVETALERGGNILLHVFAGRARKDLDGRLAVCDVDNG